MNYWLTENSTVPLITGAILVVILLCMAFSAHDRFLTFAALGVGILTFATVLCERIVVTDQEEVTSTLNVLADHVAKNNTEGILAFISTKHPEVSDRAVADMASCQFDSCRLIGTNYFKGPESGNEQAEINFVVAVSGNANKLGTAYGNAKVTLNLERESEANWKIIDYSYESPHAGLRL